MSKVEIRTLNGAYFKDVQAREDIQNLNDNIKNLAPVTSVNDKTGAVTLSAADVGAATAAQFSQLSAKIDAIGTQEEIVQAVIAALPVYNGEVV